MGVLDDQRGRAARQVAHGAAPRAGGYHCVCGRRRKATTAGSGPATRATPGEPLGLLALLCLRPCRNYKVSDERTHRIAIQAERLEDILSQMTCVKHRRYCDAVRRLR